MDAQLNFGTAFSTWLEKHGKRRALRKATTNALMKFAKRYPEYAAALFDEHFLANRAADLLGRYISSENPPKSVELAEKWAAQVHMGEGTRAAVVSKLTPAASDFLYMLENELIRGDVVRKAVTQTSNPI